MIKLNLKVSNCQLVAQTRVCKPFILILAILSCSLYTPSAIGKDFSKSADQQERPNFQVPLSFIENKGQVTDQYHKPRTDIDFKLAATNGLSIFVGNGTICYQFSKPNGDLSKLQKPNLNHLVAKGNELETHIYYTMYRMDVSLVGANKNARIIKEDKQDYFENHHTPGTGQRGLTVSSYTKITYKDIYPNIDWVLYIKDGKLEYEFNIREGGKPTDIAINYAGADDVKINNDGSLTATTPLGAITEQAPVSYQADGKKITTDFLLNGATLKYATGNYTGALVIDPGLAWATYFGGITAGSFSGTTSEGVATDGTGNVFITGVTESISGLATSGAYQTTYGGGTEDAFLAKFSTTGSLLWATYYGGPDLDDGNSVATDGAGNVYITGMTYSTSGIATPGAYQSTIVGVTDAFLAKFSSSGSLLWATYYNGSEDGGHGLATDGTGNVFISGVTTSTSGIATAGAYQTTFGGGSGDAFLAKFSSTGSLLWATYYGGTDYDEGDGVATDGSGNVFLTGRTGSTSGITTPGAYQTTFVTGGFEDAFLAKFSSTGSLLWATYYGACFFSPFYVATDGTGNAFISGYTADSSGIATPGAYQTTYGSGMFLAKFSPMGSLLWGTYYGIDNTGDNHTDNFVFGVATDPAGNAFITGYTGCDSGIVTPDGYDITNPNPFPPSNNYTIFLGEFSPSGSLLYGTYYGNSLYGNPAYGVAADKTGNVFITGVTLEQTGMGIATPGAYDTTNPGGSDGFLIKFNFYTPPTISCGGNVIKAADPGVCNAVVTYSAATATGVPVPTITYSQNSGTAFPVGITTVTVTATNAYGTASCSFTVTVNDTQNPTITAPANVIINGWCRPVSLADAGASLGTPVTADNCGVASVTNDAPLLFPVGTTTVHWTVTDIHGNIATDSQTVTVNTATVTSSISVSPIYTVVGQAPYTIYLVYHAQSVTLSASATGGTAAYGYSWAPVAGATSTLSVSPTVTTTYTVNVTDAHNCESKSTQTIYVIDIRCDVDDGKPGKDDGDQDVCICHKGKTISVDTADVAAHLAHGDNLGGCPPDNGGKFGNSNGNATIKGTETFKVYPNPTEGTFSVEIPVAQKDAEIVITDLIGRIMETRRVADNNGTPVQFCLSNAAAGLYFIGIHAGDISTVVKLVIR